MALLCSACNSSTPEPAYLDIPSGNLRLTIVRMATDPFLPRYNLTMTVMGQGGCSSSTELFPDTGYAGRRNIYLAARSMVYVVGQFDARIIDSRTCEARLSEFRHLDREVVFLGSFDEDGERHWRSFTAAERPERPFEKR
ncbi:MAG TPA: hypothetical protein VD738_05895 [Nitrospira sp.]|nr:hypothetical protein [Nitrospira sp.]